MRITATFSSLDQSCKNCQKRTLTHRRRLKNLRDPAYTVEESQRAAGLGVDNKQRGVEDVVKRMEGMDTDASAIKA